ncbi:MAG: hypothetical protein AABY53_03935 [Bdellovibrionota bacterium]
MKSTLEKIIFILSFFVVSAAQADMFRSTLFSLNTIYLDRDYDDNGVKTQSKATDTDLRLMRIEKHWSYGGIYSLSSSDASISSRTSIGLSAGYYSERDFYMNFHYYFSSKYSFGGGSEYTKGGGYEFDVGFLNKITSSFYAGIMLAIKNFTYTELTVGGVKSGTSASHKEVIPMFTFAVNLM